MRKLSKPSNNQVNTLEAIASWCDRCMATCYPSDAANRDLMNGYARDYSVSGVGPNEIGTEV